MIKLHIKMNRLSKLIIYQYHIQYCFTGSMISKTKDKQRQLQHSLELKAKQKVNEDDPRYYKTHPDFSYLSDYYLKITHQIGRGGYGVVYKAISTFSLIKEQYAVKINFNTVARQLIFSEGAFLKLCRDKKNLPKLVNFFDHNYTSHIVTEYFPHTPFISIFSELQLQQVKHYILQLLIGLKSLKQIGIFHRDIKPGNFLYNREKKTGIIIDFGLAEIDPNFEEKLRKQRQGITNSKNNNLRELDDKIMLYQKLRECLKLIGKHKIGTQSYMPLQSTLHHSYQTYESDIWPVGVILLQLSIRKYNVFNHLKLPRKISDIRNSYFVYYFLELATFFGRDAVIEQCKKLDYHVKLPVDLPRVRIKEIALIDGFDQSLQDLLFRMLELDVKRRITVQEAIAHSFFDSVRQQHFTINTVKKKG